MTLPPQDKLLHVIAGAACAILAANAAAVVAGPSTSATLYAAWFSIGFAAVVGVAKEVYDSRFPDRHTPDVGDAWATAVGGVGGAATFLLTRLLT